MQSDNSPRWINMLFTPYAIGAYLLWTLLVVGLMMADLLYFDEEVATFATAEARANWDKDQAIRRWATMHGGLYVKPDARTPPNPYLAHLPNRDVETTDGMKLTLMNPAYMMRQMTEEYEELYGVKGSITGQVLLNPINKADPWELATLKRFDAGEKEVIETTNIDGQPYLRLMRPMIMEAGCVKCHGHLGFKEGDIRGGVSVSIPLTPFYSSTASSEQVMFVAHGGIWLLGMFGIGFISIRSVQNSIEKDEANEALKVSEKGMARAQKIAHVGSWSWDIAEHKFTWSDEMHEIFGISKEDFDGTSEDMISKVVHPDDRHLLLEAQQKVIEIGEPVPLEYRIVKADGDISFVWAEGEVVKDEAGNVVRMFGAVQDITERKQAGLFLAESEERFRTLAENVPGVSYRCLCDEHWTMEIISKGIEVLAGYPVSDFIQNQARSYASIIHPDDVQMVEDTVMQAVNKQQPFTIEYRIIKADGTVCYVFERGQGVFDDKENILCLDGVILDITEQRLAEEEVKRLAAIVKHSSDFVGIADLEGHPQFINDAGRKMVGIENDEQFHDHMVIDFFPEKDRELVVNTIIPQVMDSGHWAGEINFLHFQSGEAIPVWFDMFRIDDPVSGEPINLATITRDIRESKIVELELKRYREHLEELVNARTKALEDAQEELVRKERLATLGQLTATVSHELRNPLGAMRPSLSIIEKLTNKEDGRAIKAIEIVERNIERCDRIIDELLDFTRITELDLHSTRVDEWLASVIDEQDIQAGIRVEKEFCLKDVELELDTDRLRRAVINVVDNACHAMLINNQPGNVCEGSRLNIKTATSDGRIEISVTDNGSGIAEDLRQKIFEPMFSTKGFGIGLGMPMVRHIMQQHGGGIDIDSKEGEGTTVTLWLPMAASGGVNA